MLRSLSACLTEPSKKRAQRIDKIGPPTAVADWQTNGRLSLFHEMAHAIEGSQPKMILRQEQWIKSRSSSKAPLMMRSGYGPDDMMPGYPDNFITPMWGMSMKTATSPDQALSK